MQLQVNGHIHRLEFVGIPIKLRKCNVMKKKINVGDTQKNIPHITSAQEGNLKLLLKSDQGHTIIKMVKWPQYILIRASMKSGNKKSSSMVYWHCTALHCTSTAHNTVSISNVPSTDKELGRQL
jgi:hypothetical protein